MKTSLFILAIAVIISCREHNSEGRPQTPADPKIESDESLKNLAFVAEKLVKETKGPCTEFPDEPNCLLETRTFSNSTYNWTNNSDFSVLILDADSPGQTALGRYRNRIADVVKFSGDEATLTASDLTFTFRTGLNNFFDLSAQVEHFIPAESFVDESFQNLESYFNIGDNYLNHTNFIAGFLMEQNPNASFYFSTLPSPSNSILCDESKSEELKSYFVTAGKNLAQYIVKNHITFINGSFGDSFESTTKLITSICSITRTEKLVEQYLVAASNFYRTISSLDDVIFVQAGIQSNFSGEMLVRKAPIDCDNSMDQRVRVGLFNSIDPIVADPEGVDAEKHVDILYDRTRSPLACLDVLVNGGHSPRYPFGPGQFGLKSSLTGFGLYEDTLLVTSYAAPIALSSLAHYRHRIYGFKHLSREEISKLILDYKNGHHTVMVDPLRYKQFEKYRTKANHD